MKINPAMLVISVFCSAWVGCGGGSKVRPEPRGLPGRTVGAERNRPVSEDRVAGVTYRTEPGDSRASRHFHILNRVGFFQELDERGVRYDLRLESTAAILVDLFERGTKIDSVTVRHALWMNGVPETSPATAALEAPTLGAIIDNVVALIARQATDTGTRVGLSFVEDDAGARAVAIVLPSFIEIAPFPRTMDQPAAAVLKTALAEGYRRPSVVMTAPDGSTVERVPLGGGEAFALELLQKGIWQIEVVAESPAGPEPLANFPVAVAVPHDVRLGGTRYDLDGRTSHELEEEVWDHLHAERQLRGLPSLDLDEDLSAVARSYSAEMAQTGQVAHISKISGDVADRVARAGMHYPAVAENLGQGMSPREVHLGLMSSPAHRGAILDATAYKVGIGVALDHSEVSTTLLVTQIFALRSQEVDTAIVKEQILGTVGRLRRGAGLAKLELDGVLERDAATGEALCFRQGTGVKLSVTPAAYDSVITLVWKWPGGREVSEEAMAPFVDPAFRAVGLHVVQGEDPKMGAGTVCAVILVGLAPDESP